MKYGIYYAYWEKEWAADYISCPIPVMIGSGKFATFSASARVSKNSRKLKFSVWADFSRNFGEP